MPIYEYEHLSKPSDGCQARLEVFQRMADAPLTTCPVCGGKIKKIVSAVAGFVPRLEKGRIRDLGFKKFVKRDKGVYERE